MDEVRPEVVILENVEEFQTWGPLYEDGSPIVQLRGHTFEDFIRRIKKLGYRVEWKELRACDYGAPTIRKRFFMIASRIAKPVWPKPTHAAPNDPDVIKGKKLPWRTAAEIIDWSIPCPSIFDTSEEIMTKHGVRAIRPLAENTLRRIAAGVQRYVVEAEKPFCDLWPAWRGEQGWRRTTAYYHCQPKRPECHRSASTGFLLRAKAWN